MIDWQHISTAPLDGTAVLIVYRDFGGKLASISGYYDEGLGDEDDPYSEPGWYWFDHHETGGITPLAWAHYPKPDEAARAKLGIPQVSA